MGNNSLKHNPESSNTSLASSNIILPHHTIHHSINITFAKHYLAPQ